MAQEKIEFEIDLSGKVWIDDKLQRSRAARFLTDYLAGLYATSKDSSISESFVLNVSAEWGFGKTYFLTNWARELHQSGYPVIFFDAWKTDFSREPLLAFISELRDQLQKYAKKKRPAEAALKTTLEKGKLVMRAGVPVLAEIAAKKLSGMTLEELAGRIEIPSDTSFEDLEKAVGKAVAKTAEAMLAEHHAAKESITSFRISLSNFVATLGKSAGRKLPLFVFVDELDRCRPNYAIELLEHIKHLFGVPGVYFIVATDLAQLSHSVSALYGAQFNSRAYLRRFFDQEYVVPIPDRYDLSLFLLSKFGLHEAQNFLFPHTESANNKNLAALFFAQLSETLQASPRDMNQALIIANAVRLSSPTGAKLHGVFLFLLCLAKTCAPDLFQTLSPESGKLWQPDNKLPKRLKTFSGEGRQIFVAAAEVANYYVSLSREMAEVLIDRRSGGDQIQSEIHRQLFESEFPGGAVSRGQRFSLWSYWFRVSQAGQLSG